jgi:hypothetical protein
MPDSRRSSRSPNHTQYSSSLQFSSSLIADDLAIEFRHGGSFHWGIEDGVYVSKNDVSSSFSANTRNVGNSIEQSEDRNQENNTEKKQMDLDKSLDTDEQSESDYAESNSLNSVARRTLVKELNLS